MSARLNSNAARDVAYVLHPYTNLKAHETDGPMIITSGNGVRVKDDAGKEYIEAMAGLWCASLGFSEKRLADAAYRQLTTLPYYHAFAHKSHDPAIELSERLIQMAPVPMSKVFFQCSGSEANDTVVKLVWYYNNALERPAKKKIISRIKGYHGVTIASASLTGLVNNHLDFDLPISTVRHAACPHHYRFAHEGESETEFSARLAAELDAQIEAEGPETVAAFIAEPVMAAGGVIVPPEGYFAAIQPVLEKHDVALIADEVVCAFGRLGEWFGSTAMGMRPQTVSVAKAITSAYMPLGAVIIPCWMDEALVAQSAKIGVFGHGFTYSGHPVAAAVALKAIEIYERENVFAHAREVMPLFMRRLKALADHPLVGEARGAGLMGAVELVADKAGKRAFHPSQLIGPTAAAFAQEEGLIVRAMGDAVALCPPLVITAEEVDEMFDRLGRALDRTEVRVATERLRDAA